MRPDGILLCFPLATTPLYILDVKRFNFAAFELRDCRSKLLVFAVSLLQKAKGRTDNLGRLLKQTGSYLGIHELLLLRGKFDHKTFRNVNR